jgi:hypothetical protein
MFCNPLDALDKLMLPPAGRVRPHAAVVAATRPSSQENSMMIDALAERSSPWRTCGFIMEGTEKGALRQAGAADGPGRKVYTEARCVQHMICWCRGEGMLPTSHIDRRTTSWTDTCMARGLQKRIAEDSCEFRRAPGRGSTRVQALMPRLETHQNR